MHLLPTLVNLCHKHPRHLPAFNAPHDAIAFYRDVFAATELPGRLTNPAGKILDSAILIGDSVIRVGDEAPWRIAKSPGHWAAHRHSFTFTLPMRTR
jgi:uncharacterized glyoxalase superfamily protein PhnB